MSKNTIKFPLFKILENANESTATEGRSVVAWNVGEGAGVRNYKGT